MTVVNTDLLLDIAKQLNRLAVRLMSSEPPGGNELISISLVTHKALPMEYVSKNRAASICVMLADDLRNLLVGEKDGTNEMKRTPGPWIIEGPPHCRFIRADVEMPMGTVVKQTIAQIDCDMNNGMSAATMESNAAFIVLAANCHDELVEAATMAVERKGDYLGALTAALAHAGE